MHPPPPSAPGWSLDSDDELTHPIVVGPPRHRVPLLALVIGAAAVVAGALLASARLPTVKHVLRPRESAGITLENVVVAGNLRLAAQPLSFDTARGYNECYQPDPLGLGPYAPYRISQGPVLARIAVPQKGGHTADLGYDVVVHFHGGDAVRKQFVQVVRGVVFVAVDLGNGSGPYSEKLAVPGRWPELKAEITRALREQSGDARAHIRRLALTSWSAGYGAINEILRLHGDRDVDAVVLLDSLHVGTNRRRPRRDGSLDGLSAEYVQAIFDYAAKAARGEKTFVLTHSAIVPKEGYPSVRRSADLLLREVGLTRTSQERRVGLMDQLTTADQGGFHVWGFSGRYEKAHCAHTALLGPIVRDLLESVWGTPAMNRDVPNTPPPVLGKGH